MTFLHFVRRCHLYLGLFLLPWLVMFGVSSIPLNHNSNPAPPKWEKISEIPFEAAVPPPNQNLRALGRQMMTAAGVDGGFFVNRANPKQINVNHPNFLHPIRIFYHPDQQRLVVERRELALRPFISGLHTRGGYELEGMWDNVWAVFVDILSVGLIVWIASGLLMWWNVPVVRRWGWLALASGAISFLVIILRL